MDPFSYIFLFSFLFFFWIIVVYIWSLPEETMKEPTPLPEPPLLYIVGIEEDLGTENDSNLPPIQMMPRTEVTREHLLLIGTRDGDVELVSDRIRNDKIVNGEEEVVEVGERTAKRNGPLSTAS